MKKNIDNKTHFIHFIEKWLIISIILFIIIQLTAVSIIDYFIPEDQKLTEEEYKEWNDDYIGHWYNGTFFISMTVSENFENMDTYQVMLNEKKNDNTSKISYILGTACSIIALILLVVAAVRERKKKLLEGNTPIIIALSGMFFLLYKIFEEIDLFLDVMYYRKYATGFLKTVSYYPMIYLFIIPILLILLGLTLRYFQNKNNHLIKIIMALILAFGPGFILYRFGIRVYELFMNSRIRIPFYYYMLSVPKSLALSSGAYTKLIILRFIKDLPIFISSFISIILFVKILISYLNNKIITKENTIRYRIIFILLFTSSIIFNVLGLLEVKILNSEFLYQYKEATYTFAIRSLTEPLLYALFIYMFKYYIEISIKTKNRTSK